MGPFGYGQYYTGHEMSTPGHGSMSQSEAYVQAESYANSAYPTSGMSVPNQYGGINNQVNQSYDSGHSMQTPISAQSMPTTLGPVSGGGFGPPPADGDDGDELEPGARTPSMMSEGANRESKARGARARACARSVSRASPAVCCALAL